MPLPSDVQAALHVEEFRALRATIRERGTLRIALAGLGLAGWAAGHLAVLMWLPTPGTMLVPLLVLAALFEAVYALHIGVERIGRYLEAVYESGQDGPRWERTANEFGRTMTDSTGKLDALFSTVFCAAAVLNLIPVVWRIAAAGRWTTVLTAEIVVSGGLHLAFIIRVFRARAFAARQRRLELELFERLAAGDS